MKQQGKQKKNKEMQEQVRETPKGTTRSLYNMDKLMMQMSIPFLLFLAIGGIFGFQGTTGSEVFMLFVAHVLIYAVSRHEKKSRAKGKESQAINMLAWMLFSFLLGYYLMGMFFAVIISVTMIFVSGKFNLHSNFITLSMMGVWFWNIVWALFFTDLSGLNKLLLIYTPGLMEDTDWLHFFTILAVVGLGIYKQMLNNPVSETMEKVEEEKVTYNEETKKTATSSTPKQEEPVAKQDESYDYEEERLAKNFFEPSKRSRSLKDKLMKYLKF